MKFIIKLRDIPFKLYLGVYDHEQLSQMEIYISFYISLKLSKLNSDKIDFTLDYDQIVLSSKEFLASKRFALIEYLGQELIEYLYKKYDQIDELKLEIKKPSAIKNGLVSVLIKY